MDSGSSVPESGEYSNDIQNKMVTLNDVDGHEENNLCSNCKKELSPDHIKERDSNLYCEDCYNSLFNKNCSVCGEPITDESYVDEMGNYYHKEHSTCFCCKQQLSGNDFVKEEIITTERQSHPCCPSCSKLMHEAPCHVCNTPITSDRAFDGTYWYHEHCLPQRSTSETLTKELSGEDLRKEEEEKARREEEEAEKMMEEEEAEMRAQEEESEVKSDEPKTAEKPETSEAEKPETSEAEKPETSEAEKPEGSEDKKPEGSEDKKPEASEAEKHDEPSLEKGRYSELQQHEMQRALERAKRDEERRKEREERRKQRQLERERRRSSICVPDTSIYSSGPSETEKQRHAEEERNRFIQKIRARPRAEETTPASDRRQEAINKLREQEEEEMQEKEKRREEEEKRREEERRSRTERVQQALQIISDDEKEDLAEEKPLPSGRRITSILSASYAVRPERTSFMPKATRYARNSIFEYAQYGDYKKMDAQEDKQEEVGNGATEEYQKEQQRIALLPNGSLKVYPYSTLIQSPLPSDVDPKRREYHLSEEEFEKVFNMSRSKYESLPGWKRILYKKQVKLF